VLIDDLERAAEELGKKKQEYQGLSREYRRFYSKDLREEMAALREEITLMSRGIDESLYENLRELLLIKRYFPDLYAMLLDDKAIGKLVRGKDWLLVRKEEKKEDAERALRELKAQRAQLREARKFIAKWPRSAIDAKSITATWPALKGALEGEPEKEDALDAIRKKERDIVRRGWLILLNESMIAAPLGKIAGKIDKLRSEEEAKRAGVEASRGKGSVKEYEALRDYEKAKKERERMERIARHLLLANPGFVEKMKKAPKQPSRPVFMPGRAGKANKPGVGKILDSIVVRKINETVWLKEMKTKLGIPD